MKCVTRILFVISAFITLAGVSGCDDSQDMKNWMENTEKLKIAARAASQMVPYRTEQHKALKGYFSELGNMALALKNDSKLTERFNAAISQMEMGKLCARVFIPRAEWNPIMGSCTRNRFFLCAEEVRAYPDFVAAFRARLTSEHQRRFDQAEACQRTLL